MKRILIGLLFIFTTTAANAAVKYAGHATVKRYYPVKNTHTYLQLDIPLLDPAGCGSTHYYVMTNAHPEFEEYRRLILTAKASGQKLGVYIWADAGRCHGSYPEIYSMFIQ